MLCAASKRRLAMGGGGSGKHPLLSDSWAEGMTVTRGCFSGPLSATLARPVRNKKKGGGEMSLKIYGCKSACYLP